MKQTSMLPMMSIVVISYNGAATIERALDSLLTQDYPTDRFEIIFVNDGSTDNTRKVVTRYPTVRYIELAVNSGVPAARNAGLEVAQGDIYVSFDGDCAASPDWLTQLARGYRLARPAGVGGTIADLVPARGIACGYISTTGHGATRAVAVSRFLPSALNRLRIYIISHFGESNQNQASYSEVSELYGANCSFPMSVLRAVGGWDTDMAGIEDRDLSLRIRNRYPKKHFYAMHNAKIMHDPFISLKTYLLRPYRRGPVNYLFHASNAMTPPLFPFPFLLLVIFLLCSVHSPGLFVISLLVGPQLLYFWWPARAIRQLKPIYLVFTYLQLFEETMVLCGLTRGYILHKRKQHAKS